MYLPNLNRKKGSAKKLHLKKLNANLTLSYLQNKQKYDWSRGGGPYKLIYYRDLGLNIDVLIGCLFVRLEFSNRFFCYIYACFLRFFYKILIKVFP